MDCLASFRSSLGREIVYNVKCSSTLGFNSWFSNEQISAYIRLGPRRVAGVTYNALQLANVSTATNALNQGHFSDLLHDLQLIASEMKTILFIENVMSEIVYGALNRRHYLVVPGSEDGWSTSFYLPAPV